MIETLQALRLVFGPLSGNLTVDELRKLLIEKMEVKNDDGTLKTYEQLTPRDKLECDEAVKGLVALSGIFVDIVKAKAKMTKVYFDALQAEGFTPEQALALTVASQPTEVK